jgi:hypothetical protein
MITIYDWTIYEVRLDKYKTKKGELAKADSPFFSFILMQITAN